MRNVSHRQQGVLDKATSRKVDAARQCGAEATYQEFKDEPVTAQYSLPQDRAMQQKIATIMKDCSQKAGLQ